MSEAPDQAARLLAVATRDRTVLIDAGAGAGKTSILVARILALVAPPNDSDTAIPLSRIAAVTFTRRAAGELRLRVREGVLRELTRTGLSDVRRRRLLDALGKIDVAMLGTIHGFADRLLRLQPMKARLSPAYAIAEDIDELVEETFDLLLHAVQHGTLASELDGYDAAYASEVERTFQEALKAGALVRSFERDPKPPKVGLDLLIRGFIEQRDRELGWQGDGAFDRVAFETAAREFLALLDPVREDGMRGTRWLIRFGARLRDLLAAGDPLALYELVARVASGKGRFKQTKDFAKKSAAQALWIAFKDNLSGRLTQPLFAAMARRLARTRHAVVHLYDKVKTRREAIDSIDLLKTFRDLLRDDRDARTFYQGLFDHMLVDELQDTDPLQAEIILYLAEATPKASRWQDLVVGNGRLTLVGDPKQSIYRFRRADVGMYEHIRNQILVGDHVPITLSANFRSVPRLIEWANDRFADILGTSTDRTFDPATGQVFHQPQVPARASTDTPAVHALPYAFADGEDGTAEVSRRLEGRAIAAYLRSVVARKEPHIVDPDRKESRPIVWSDIAVLALVTTNLPLLFDALDAEDVPFAMAGGTLFTSDPLHQQFLLGLRAIADRNDGVAEAALLREPFFTVDLLCLLRERAQANDEPAARAAAARAWIADVRRQRFARSPGETARALLEETGIGRVIALGPNGEQRLHHLRELCIQLELLAANEGLDYDGVTARLRDWIEQPPALDPPRPVAAEAIQVLTVHQAKGLEFPVVVLWDGMGQWRPYEAAPAWRVDRDGSGWSMKTNDVTWEEPPGNTMLDRERAYAEAERRRLVYVAATRARDVLIVPKPAWTQLPEKFIHARLLANPQPQWVQTVDTFVEGRGASWSLDAAARAPIGMIDDSALTTSWTAARDAARQPRHAPKSVTALAKGDRITLRVDDTELEASPPQPQRIGRHGPLFGDVVHAAIGLVLSKGMEAAQAVQQAAALLGLDKHLDHAVADVERAIAALHAESLLVGRDFRLEYPVAAPLNGHIVSGYIDLITASATDTAVIDFKTDRWPRGVDALRSAFPAYVSQVQTYTDMVGGTRAALLFTETGRLAWITR